mmetsp:Transcript_7992/g.9140  ORF Transcript_7992/g.9140 Transcript_7992/m.9140 type:complete len:195 (+) Transcript_7992:108-692(+)
MMSFAKIVVLGNDGVGRRHLLNKILGIRDSIKLDSPRELYSTASDRYQAVSFFCVGNHQVFRGAGEFNGRMNQLRNADCILLCFSPEKPESFHDLVNAWLPRIAVVGASAPIIVACCKSDLRKNATDLERQGVRLVDEDICAEIVGTRFRGLEIKDYIECSALENENVDEVLQACLRVIKPAEPNLYDLLTPQM